MAASGLLPAKSIAANYQALMRSYEDDHDRDDFSWAAARYWSMVGGGWSVKKLAPACAGWKVAQGCTVAGDCGRRLPVRCGADGETPALIRQLGGPSTWRPRRIDRHCMCAPQQARGVLESKFSSVRSL
jgi:hypothetical protein